MLPSVTGSTGSLYGVAGPAAGPNCWGRDKQPRRRTFDLCTKVSRRNPVSSLWRLIPHLKPYWLPALLAPLFMALEVALDLVQPRLLQIIVDTDLPKGDLHAILHTGGIMIAAGLVGLIAGAACGVFATIAGLGFGADLRGAIFRKIQSLSFGNLERLETGRLITRLTNDIDQVQEAALMLMRNLVRAPLLVVGSLIMAVLRR